MKRFTDLREPEILALAISNEEEDARIYLQFASRIGADYPATAAMFERMAQEEQGHRHALHEMFRKKFGEALPYITRQDVKGFLKRNPIWLLETLRIDAVRRQAEMMEFEAQQFYIKAAERARDSDTRRLLSDLAEAESAHGTLAQELGGQLEASGARETEKDAAHRIFVLQIVQPGLAGLIDGSISTLAPIFAAAFATQDSWAAFLVGLAASIGAGISMGLTEGLSDDGAITGRGSPWPRGIACGVMTTLGGLGHTLPYLIPDFWTATAVAGVVVAIELAAIAYVRMRYMETPFGSAIVQVVLGGILVLLTGIFIGSS
ncbi:iron exporter MbfA [Ancylobacter sp. TS-1]|uniref:iron exporter MbfA n=1 Tax=Ancylobacter sp. TS-1 TaxID=1850374 RepID=UPI001265C2BC|nr:ferritin family protein [Ancylobacter sp. TS-1]QFR34014.1 rubrerythrin [Ancylobacter sp. TS-1]